MKLFQPLDIVIKIFYHFDRSSYHNDNFVSILQF